MHSASADGASVLAIDAGTSALRATVVDLRGDTLATATEGIDGVRSDGTIDVAAVWDGVVRAVRLVQPAAAHVEAVGVSAQLALVLVDARGRPTRPALAWSDRRAVSEARELERLIGTVARVTGRRCDPELWAPKLLWLHRHEPEALAAARWALSLKDYLVLRLTGNAITDETHASYTFLFDVVARAWSRELVDAAELPPAMLPTVADASAVAGELTAEAAAELGLRAGVTVAVGGPDGTLGALGAGAVRPGVTVDIAGSTDVLLHVVHEPQTDPAAEAVLNAHAAPRLWTVGGPTGLTGGAAAWIAQLLGVATADLYERWGDEAADVAADAAGLLFVPTLTGSRFPRWAPSEVGSIRGLTPAHGAAHLLRAAEEGAAFVVLEGLETLERLGHKIDEVIVAGGAAVRPAALQLRADAWNREIRSLANEQASTIGAAALAATAAGLVPSVADAIEMMLTPGRTYEPACERTKQLRAVYRRWCDRRLDAAQSLTTYATA